MIQYIVLVVVLIYFLIASIEDIKKREVYDYLNYSLVFFLLLVGIFSSYELNSLEPLNYIGFGLLIGFGLGSVLYFLGIWGGGDAKFMIGFGAASYYLKNFISEKFIFHNLNFFFFNKFNEFFKMFFDYFIIVILFLNFIFILFLCFNFLKFKLHSKNSESKLYFKNIFTIFLILFFLNFGIFLKLSPIYLTSIGVIVFILLFFSDDYLFFSVFLKIKKYVKDIKIGDVLDKSLIFSTNSELKNSNSINFSDQKYGLNNQQVEQIKLNLKQNNILIIRKYLPFSLLIGLNFILYLIKIIHLNSVNLEIIFFLFEFLFVSFIIGGIITILILIYFLFKHFKEINFKITKKLLYLFIIYSGIILFFSIVLKHIILLLLLLLIPIYFFIQFTKEIERIGFIKNKSINNITLGDWIVEDIKINNKIIFHVEDFKLGVDEFQLKKIKQLAKTHKNLEYLKVKDGLAFLPPLFIGFLIMILI